MEWGEERTKAELLSAIHIFSEMVDIYCDISIGRLPVDQRSLILVEYKAGGKKFISPKRTGALFDPTDLPPLEVSRGRLLKALERGATLVSSELSQLREKRKASKVQAAKSETAKEVHDSRAVELAEEQLLEEKIPLWRWPESAERNFVSSFLSDPAEKSRIDAILNGPPESALALLLVHFVRYYAELDGYSHAASRTAEICDCLVSSVREKYDSKRQLYEFQTDPNYLFSEMTAILVNMEVDARGVFQDLQQELYLVTKYMGEEKMNVLETLARHYPDHKLFGLAVDLLVYSIRNGYVISLSKAAKEWTTTEVCWWLEQLRMFSSVKVFRECDVNGNVLLELGDQDLEDTLEVSDVRYRRKLLNGTSLLKPDAAVATASRPGTVAFEEEGLKIKRQYDVGRVQKLGNAFISAITRAGNKSPFSKLMSQAVSAKSDDKDGGDAHDDHDMSSLSALQSMKEELSLEQMRQILENHREGSHWSTVKDTISLTRQQGASYADTVSKLYVLKMCNDALKKRWQRLPLSNSLLVSDSVNLLSRFLRQTTTLSRLEVSFCGLTDVLIPKLIAGLKKNNTVKHIVLSGNKLTSKGVEHISELCPASVSPIETLDLSSNQIGSAGACTLAEAVTKEIEYVESSLVEDGRELSLQLLFLQDCGITKAGAERLAQLVDRCEGRIAVSIIGNKIGKGAIAFTRSIAKCIPYSTSYQQYMAKEECRAAVRGLDFRRCYLGIPLAADEEHDLFKSRVDVHLDDDDDDERMANVLKRRKPKRGRRKSIVGRTTDEEKQVLLVKGIVDALLESGTVSALLLPENSLVGKSLAEFSRFLDDPLKVRHLVKVDLSNNDIDADGVGAFLTSTLVETQLLKDLVLSDNTTLGDTGLGVIGEALRNSKSIRRLRLQKVGATHNGLAALCGHLRFVKSLELLDVGNNQVGDKGALAVADLFRVGRPACLAEVDLSRCGISGDGAFFLTRGLSTSEKAERKRPSLKMTTSSRPPTSTPPGTASSYGSSEGGGAINFRVLHDNSGVLEIPDTLTRPSPYSIKWLCLDDNKIGDEGAMAMAMLLRANGGLRSLSLNGNGIHSVGASSLAGSIAILSKTSHGVREIWLQGNAIGREGTMALANATQGHNPVRIYNPSVDEELRQMKAMIAERGKGVNTAESTLEGEGTGTAVGRSVSPWNRAMGREGKEGGERAGGEKKVDRLILREDGRESIKVGQTFPAGILRTAGRRSPLAKDRKKLERKTTFLDPGTASPLPSLPPTGSGQRPNATGGGGGALAAVGKGGAGRGGSGGGYLAVPGQGSGGGGGGGGVQKADILRISSRQFRSLTRDGVSQRMKEETERGGALE